MTPELKINLNNLKPTERLLDFTLYTKPDFVLNWHHELVSDELMKFLNREIKEDNLLVTMPPSHSKTELVVRRFVAFCFGLNPLSRVLIASYDKTLSKRSSRDIKRIIQSEKYQRLFPLELSKTKKSDEEWETSLGGGLLAVGVGSGVTGAHFDLMIADDLYQGWKAAQSPVKRKTTNDWYDTDFSNRERIAAGKVLRIVMGTRWHFNDTIGMLEDRVRKDPKAESLRKLYLPAYFTKKNSHLRHEKDTRDLGEPLFKANKDKTALDKAEAKGAAKFAALYLCVPFRPKGDQLDPAWFQTIKTKELPDRLRVKRFNHLPELSLKIDDQSFATCKMGRDIHKNFYILDCRRFETSYAEFTEMINRTAALERGVYVGFRKYPPRNDLFACLKKNRPRGRRFKQIELTTPLSMTQLAKSGKIILVEDDWTEDLLETFAYYTATGMDEKESQIHAMAGAINMFRLRRMAA